MIPTSDPAHSTDGDNFERGSPTKTCPVEATPPCPECKDWGETIPEFETRIVWGKEITFRPTRIACPKCGRMTWPNLGVNCPAGCAVSLGTTGAIEMMRALNPERVFASISF